MKRRLLCIIRFIQSNPAFLFWLNLGLLLFLLPWTALLAIPGSPLYTLGTKVWYVTFISHIALILGALSTLQSARVEIKQSEQDEALHKKIDNIERK